MLANLAVRASRSQASRAVTRTFATTAARRSGGHGPPQPQLFGPGAKPGTIPTDFEQATGLERYELLGRLEGIEVFDNEPLDSSRKGTTKEPIKVFSLATQRQVGCTGSPADSHEVGWFNLKLGKTGRCTECGSVYELDYQGPPLDDHHH